MIRIYNPEGDLSAKLVTDISGVVGRSILIMHAGGVTKNDAANIAQSALAGILVRVSRDFGDEDLGRRHFKAAVKGHSSNA